MKNTFETYYKTLFRFQALGFSYRIVRSRDDGCYLVQKYIARHWKSIHTSFDCCTDAIRFCCMHVSADITSAFYASSAYCKNNGKSLNIVTDERK